MASRPPSSDVPQNLKEYDPEWARAFYTGTASAGCDHARMLSHVRVPVLYTHHFRAVDDETGGVIGASSDMQAKQASALVTAAGQLIDYRSLPNMAHSLHGQDPELFASILVQWSDSLAT